jgi:hypothetical protein
MDEFSLIYGELIFYAARWHCQTVSVIDFLSLCHDHLDEVMEVSPCH